MPPTVLSLYDQHPRSTLGGSRPVRPPCSRRLGAVAASGPAGDWFCWALVAGRGSGKTDAASAYVDWYARRNPGCGIAVIAPTLGDAVDSCVNGPSGLRAHNPEVKLASTPGGTYIRWPNGAEGKLFGASSPEDVERLRAGGNRHLCWAEELCAWRHDTACWDHMRFELRLGPHPRVVVSTTPKPRPLIVSLLKAPSTVVTSACTADNPHLDAGVRAALHTTVMRTRDSAGRSCWPSLLQDSPDALWSLDMLDASRVDSIPDGVDLVRIAVAVDPATTASETSDETGIVVVGKGTDGRGYVLADASGRYSPDVWARRVVNLFDGHTADTVVIETNQGGDMAEQTLRTVRETLPIVRIHRAGSRRALNRSLHYGSRAGCGSSVTSSVGRKPRIAGVTSGDVCVWGWP